MTAPPTFLDLPVADRQSADVLLLPLPYEGTVSYGTGTGRAPEAIWRASAHIECWDEETDFDLDSLAFHAATPLIPGPEETPEQYATRAYDEASRLHRGEGLVVGVGGEHSVTPPLVEAAVEDREDLSQLTVVQFDAHADLRDVYDQTPYSHACAMRRLTEKGAAVLAIGIRSMERAEFDYGRQSGQVRTYTAQCLANDPHVEKELLDQLLQLAGRLYVTIDVDVLDAAMCPATGTPQPGGLGWWQLLRYLRCLLFGNESHRLVGFDVVETVPQDCVTINETTAARLLTKVMAYHFAGRSLTE
jgi:agmatinase